MSNVIDIPNPLPSSFVVAVGVDPHAEVPRLQARISSKFRGPLVEGTVIQTREIAGLLAERAERIPPGRVECLQLLGYVIQGTREGFLGVAAQIGEIAAGVEDTFRGEAVNTFDASIPQQEPFVL